MLILLLCGSLQSRITALHIASTRIHHENPVSQVHHQRRLAEAVPSDDRPQIAFAGRSNVGKSSLINAFLNRKNLVKTSATPGKTQLINFFLINDEFYCVDLPGYGYAKAPRSVVDAWAPMIEGYIRDSPQIRVVVVLLDIRREPDTVMNGWSSGLPTTASLPAMC